MFPPSPPPGERPEQFDRLAPPPPSLSAHTHSPPELENFGTFTYAVTESFRQELVKKVPVLRKIFIIKIIKWK
jgi:hypothetical protein